MAAAAFPLLGGKVAADEAAGMIKKVIDALNKDLITCRWERDPKTKKLVLVSVEGHLTTGIVLGGAALAMAWEIANWFAKSGIGNASAPGDVVDVISLLTLNPVAIALTDLFGNPILNPNGSPKTVSAPPTFGAAFNVMMRNFVIAGPGQLMQEAVSLVGNATTGGGTAPSSASRVIVPSRHAR